MTISENSKTTLGVAGGILLGALAAQSFVLTKLNGTLGREEAERTYVRQDVLAEQFKLLDQRLSGLEHQVSELRLDVSAVQFAVRPK